MGLVQYYKHSEGESPKLYRYNTKRKEDKP